jgi:voltage-gated potassium channel
LAFARNDRVDVDHVRGLRAVGIAIWILFIAEFLLRFGLAPEKYPFLQANVITIIALVAPAFRLFRALRLLRFVRGVRLVRIVGTANRSLNALPKSFRRRGLGYVLGATVLITVLGAAGMLALEPARLVEGGFTSYGDALWWTVMLITTIGTDFWPRTAEGRVLAFLLAIYGLAVFGYITASFASFFIGQDLAVRARASRSGSSGLSRRKSPNAAESSSCE